MKQGKRRVFPILLMALGTALLGWGLFMLERTPPVLEYAVVATEPGEGGEVYRQLGKSARQTFEPLTDTFSAATVSGYHASTVLTLGDESATVALYAVDEGYFEVYPIAIEQGRRISETELRRGERWALLDEALGFQLFGEQIPENGYVQLGDKRYSVAGTVRHRRGVGDAREYDVYVPLNAAAADGLEIQTMTLSARPIAASGATQLFKELAASEWAEGGTMVSLEKEAMRRTILPRVILLIAGLYILIGLFKRMTRRFGKWLQDFRQAMKDAYITALLPKLLGLILKAALGYGTLLGLVAALMTFSVQPLYVFTEWVPDVIVEWASLKKVFWSLIGESALPVRVGSRALRQVAFWGGMVRWGCVALLLGGTLRGKKQ